MTGPVSAPVREATRSIIVARSHPTIANPIRALLGGIGYRAQPYDGRSSLNVVTRDDVAGALISTAATIEVEQSPVEVLARLRALRPELPVALVTIVPFDRLRRSMSHQLGSDVELIEGSALALRRPDVGLPDVIPVIQVEDIILADGKDITSAILARHFRWFATRHNRASTSTTSAA